MPEDRIYFAETLQELKDIEWSMGCNGKVNKGQCPVCCGVNESWLGHPLHLDAKELGHKKDCKFAKRIESNGGECLYEGQSKLTDIYESCTTKEGFWTTRLKNA